jgi:hypothetical protein
MMNAHNPNKNERTVRHSKPEQQRPPLLPAPWYVLLPTTYQKAHTTSPLLRRLSMYASVSGSAVRLGQDRLGIVHAVMLSDNRAWAAWYARDSQVSTAFTRRGNGKTVLAAPSAHFSRAVFRFAIAGLLGFGFAREGDNGRRIHTRVAHWQFGRRCAARAYEDVRRFHVPGLTWSHLPALGDGSAEALTRTARARPR